MSLRSDDPYEVVIFADLMFDYINHGLSFKKHGTESDWWMDKKKRDFWFHRAFHVRKSIKNRVPEYVW